MKRKINRIIVSALMLVTLLCVNNTTNTSMLINDNSIVAKADDVTTLIAKGLGAGGASVSDISNVSQLVLVRGTSGTNAEFYMLEKDGTTWKQKSKVDGVVGSHGIGKASESDSKSPKGLYSLGFGFGTEDLSGLNIEYRKLSGTEYWVDDPSSQYYNKWVDTKETSKDWSSAEDLKGAGRAYKYTVVVNYNMDPIVPGDGSAIFFHVKTAASTAGCLAIPEDNMLEVLKWLDSSKNPHILIYNSSEEPDDIQDVVDSLNSSNLVTTNQSEPSKAIDYSNDVPVVQIPSWVLTKDMFRHGGQEIDTSNDTSTANSSGNPIENDVESGDLEEGDVEVEYHLGMAQGEYSIKLDDGTWYWYHQTNVLDNCKYCGTWTSRKVLGTSPQQIFGDRGCAVYSSAIIASNLAGKAITPDIFLKDMGAELGNNTLDTSNSDYFSKGVVMYGDYVADFLCEKYGLERTEPLGKLSKSDMKTQVDEVLDKEGMIWYQLEAKAEGNWFPPYTTDTHLIAIRRRDGDNYYILDESLPQTSYLNKAISFDDIYKYLHNSKFMYGFWNPNPVTIKVKSESAASGGSSTSSSSWYSSAKDIKKYTNEKNLGSIKIYDGLPWEADDKTYVVDTTKMLDGMYTYVKNNSSGTEALASGGATWSPSNAFNNSDISNGRIYRDNNLTGTKKKLLESGGFKDGTVGGYTKNVSSIQTLAVVLPPGIVNKTYNVSFGDYNSSDKTNLWQMKATNVSKFTGKLALVLKNKNDNSISYLPVSLVDTNENSFPGGVTHTGIRLASESDISSSGKLNHFGNLEKETGLSGLGSSTTEVGKLPSDIMTIMNQRLYGSANYTAWDLACTHVELWAVPKDTSRSLGNYQCIGVVVWGK